jgi:hypothetical protein
MEIIMSVFDKLTEGIVNRDLAQEGAALLTKWEKTGLLEGLESDHKRAGMARLLENQAKQLLKETSVMAASGGGDVQGFSAVAFPLVRRVFAGLFANDIVSVQPMSLPSGLIFFLDFTTAGDLVGGRRLGYPNDTSLFGGGRIASQITGGLDLALENADSGPYSLNNGYGSPTGSADVTLSVVASGTVGDGGIPDITTIGGGKAATISDALLERLLRFDPDIVSGSAFAVASLTTYATTLAGVDVDNFIGIRTTGTLTDSYPVRRLTKESELEATSLQLVFVSTASNNLDSDIIAVADEAAAVDGLNYPLKDTFANATPVGAVNATEFGLENETAIPEIDIKVDSVAVTAQTKKLKAKWTPELGQDLNAYHNLDAEVELTSILSEQIALEIDHEILNDLIQGATAGTYYWSRSPGLFVDRLSGVEVGASAAAPDFTGTVSEWYETLIETINDVSAQIHRKTLRGGANFIVTSPEVANILEFTAGFRAAITADDQRGDIGAVRVGSLSKKFDVFVDPYFPRNLVLVGRRGASFLESGYVYAPYVPLQVTPTIFGVEDFVPRKGVMTRYAKKMVRPDMYGLVICRGLLGESGS